MKKKIFSSVLFVSLLLCINGCDNEEVKVSSGTNLTQEHIQQAENLDKKSYQGLEDVFLDTKTITANDRIPLLIFGKNNCTYCEKLKTDIKEDSQLKNLLQQYFAPYYINVSYSKIHHLEFDKPSSLSTSDLMDTYVTSPLRPTPTLVFLNDKGTTTYELPGYLPPKEMRKVLEYMRERQWQNKSNATIASEIDTLLRSSH
ncbi:hypothetical protein LS68_008660 [Helicobacter sp. MIT 05-5293]|uniref:SoxW family protein n=1 Tax=Helicobacter sp. MIT 05-5293 TaxID=1548149 RepID=UPI00051D9A13|nr:thioredoxin family protein [Helicobacter sp. MIT 05-5293]TLD79907.1 hypothetical protein LS68_008660 [Helicobacter sp. MIT 05-5293]